MKSGLLLLLVALASPCLAGSALLTEGTGAQPQDSGLSQSPGWLNLLRSVLALPLTDTLHLQARLGGPESRGQDPTRTTISAQALELSGWRPGLDRVAESLDSERGRAPWLRAGLRWGAIADRLVVDGSVGVKAGGQPSVTLSLGLKFAL